MQDPKEALNKAIEPVHATERLNNEDRPSICQIAAEFDVSHVTLSNCLAGRHTDQRTAHAHEQALTPGEEDLVVTWIRSALLSGHPPPVWLVRQVAQLLMQPCVSLESLIPTPILSPNPLPKLGANWITGLKSRHPTLYSDWTHTIDTNRLEGVTAKKLTPYFNQLKILLDTHCYPPSHIFNMDETGVAIGTTQSSQVLAYRELGRGQQKAGTAWKAGGTRGEWMTSIECISASGRALPPLVIMKGREFYRYNLPLAADRALVKGWSWTASNKGWSSDYLALKWLNEVFIPNTPMDKQRLLIVDGHGSHIKAEFIATCMNRHIDLIVLPSHTSHKTQPLDIGLFQPLKKALLKSTDLASRYTSGGYNKQLWVTNLARARHIAFTEQNIKVGWKEAGIVPFLPSCLIRLATPPPSTPPPCSEPSNVPVTTPTARNRRFLADLGVLATPTKRKLGGGLSELVEVADKVQARNTVLEKENRGMDAILRRPKKPGQGATVGYLETHVMTTDENLETVMGLELSREMKKQSKKKGKEKEKAPEVCAQVFQT